MYGEGDEILIHVVFNKPITSSKDWTTPLTHSHVAGASAALGWPSSFSPSPHPSALLCMVGADLYECETWKSSAASPDGNCRGSASGIDIEGPFPRSATSPVGSATRAGVAHIRNDHTTHQTAPAYRT